MEMEGSEISRFKIGMSVQNYHVEAVEAAVEIDR